MVSKEELENLGSHILKEPALSFRLCLPGLQPEVCLDLSLLPELPASELIDRDLLLAAWPPLWPRDPLLEAEERLEADTVIQSRSILSIHDNTERGNVEATSVWGELRINWESRCVLALFTPCNEWQLCLRRHCDAACSLLEKFSLTVHCDSASADPSLRSPGGIRAQCPAGLCPPRGM